MTACDPLQSFGEKMNQSTNVSIRAAILATLIMAAPPVMAAEIVAILDLKFIENTGDPAGYICFVDDECDVWAVFYLFEATVDKVISGELPDQNFLVLYGSHALKEQNFPNVVALLKRRDSDDPTEPRYQITQWGNKREMYCFDRREDEEPSNEVILNEHYELNCYDPLTRSKKELQFEN